MLYSVACFAIVVAVQDIGIFQVYAGGIMGVMIGFGIPGLAGWYKYGETS
jgi:hypothetical protein